MDIYVPDRDEEIERVLSQVPLFSRSGMRLQPRFTHGWPQQSRCCVLSHSICPTMIGWLQGGAGALLLCGKIDEAAHDFLRQAGRNATVFGVREWSPQALHTIRTQHIRSYAIHEISREGLIAMTDAVMEHVLQWRTLHVIVDSSVVDPAFAGGGGVPGGLTTNELFYVLGRLVHLANLGVCQVRLSSGAPALSCAISAVAVAECSVDGKLPEKTVAL